MAEPKKSGESGTELETPDSNAWKREVERTHWGLMCRLSGITQGRPGQCRHVRTAPTVQVIHVPHGPDAPHDAKPHVSLHGVAACGSVWACPVCSRAICTVRAQQVQAMVKGWGQARTAMVTLTMRHHDGNVLAHETRGVAKAWQSLWAGRAVEQSRKRWGLGPWVRAVEVTHGRNGWHAHIHAVLCFEKELTHPELLAEEWLERWRAAVASNVGVDAVPSEHGIDVSPVHESSYLAKLGLEVAGARKRARSAGGKHPWDLAELASGGDPLGTQLWREYVAGTKGHRQLTWARSAKVFTRTEAEIVSERPDGAMLVEYDHAQWRMVTVRRCGIAEVIRIAQDSVA